MWKGIDSDERLLLGVERFFKDLWWTFEKVRSSGKTFNFNQPIKNLKIWNVLWLTFSGNQTLTVKNISVFIIHSGCSQKNCPIQYSSVDFLKSMILTYCCFSIILGLFDYSLSIFLSKLTIRHPFKGIFPDAYHYWRLSFLASRSFWSFRTTGHVCVRVQPVWKKTDDFLARKRKVNFP